MIIDAVRGVARGEEGWLSRRAVARMSAWTRDEKTSSNEGLSEREIGVLRLIAAGKTNQEIGLALKISEKTVEKHVSAILAKLHVASRTEAAVYAVQHGFL
jgi:DNA-binding NarL/FixJ family response regulator